MSGRGVQEACIRLTDIHPPVFRGRSVLVCHIRRTDFHRNCICRNYICRNSRRRTSTEAVKSISSCSCFQLLSAIDYAESHFLTKKESTAILQVRNKGVFIRWITPFYHTQKSEKEHGNEIYEERYSGDGRRRGCGICPFTVHRSVRQYEKCGNHSQPSEKSTG